MLSNILKGLMALAIVIRFSSGLNAFAPDKSMCVFPFRHNGITYNSECAPPDFFTNKLYPWCPTTEGNLGIWSYCIDYTKSNLVCSDSCRTVHRYPQCNANGRAKICLENILDFSKKPIGNCSQEYSNISPYHTACLPPRPNVAKVGLTERDKVEILEVHNRFRRNTAVPAKKMQKIYWDDDLAFVAQKHANRCQFAHDNSKLRSMPGRGRNTGQNIMYVSSWNSFAEEFTLMFNAEIIMWDYGTGLKEQFRIFGGYPGHYIQLIVEEVSRVGCGYAECVFYDRVDRALVCNYNYPFTYSHELKPYEEGVRCSGCPGKCSDGLCDCKGKECWNGGTLNLNDCSCKCDPFFYGEKCENPYPTGLDEQGCYFPFIYDNEVYYDCADWGGGDVWCSTTKYYGNGNPPDIYCVPKTKRKRSRMQNIRVDNELSFDPIPSQENIYNDEVPQKRASRQRPRSQNQRTDPILSEIDMFDYEALEKRAPHQRLRNNKK